MSEDIRAKCSNCGGDSFSWPSSDSEPRDDEIVTCAGCGANIRMSDIRTQMMKKGEKIVQDKFKKLIDDFNKR